MSIYYSIVENQRWGGNILKHSRRYLISKLLEYSNILPNLYFYTLHLLRTYNIRLKKDILNRVFCVPLFQLHTYKGLSSEGVSYILDYYDLIIRLNLMTGLLRSYIVKSLNLDLSNLICLFNTGTATDFGGSRDFSIFKLVLDKLTDLSFLVGFSLSDILFLKNVLVLDVKRVSESGQLFQEKYAKLDLICRAVHSHILGKLFMKSEAPAVSLLKYNLISLDVIFGPVLTIYKDGLRENNLS